MDDSYPDPPPGPEEPSQEQTQAGPQTYHSELDPAYAEPALEAVRHAVKGNALKPADVKMTKIEGSVLEFIAVTLLTLQVKMVKKTVGGKKTGARLVKNEQMLREEVSKEQHKITHSADVIKRIKDVLLNRPDKGFGLDNEMIRLEFLHKEFVIHEPCGACHTKGHVQCQRCHGNGYETCPKCHGQGQETCPQCRGAQMIQGPQGRQQCPTCHGQGRMSCRQCNQQRKVPCTVCKTKGTTQCKLCNGHAWTSHIHTAEINAVGNFDFDREHMPEKVAAEIEACGKALVNDIHFIPVPIAKETEDKADQKENREIFLSYHVKLPYADTNFALGHKASVPLFLFGVNCRIISPPDFLTELISPGAQKLQDAADNTGDVAALIKEASKFKTLKQAIIASARYSNRKAAKALYKSTPLGLSTDSIKRLVINADKALKNITSKPRQLGMFGGIAGGAIFLTVYFLGGVRSVMTKQVPDAALHMGVDVLILALALLISSYAIKIAGAGAMKKALTGIVPAGKEKAFMPKLGKQGFWAMLATLMIFLGCLEAGWHMDQAVNWYAEIRKSLPL